MDLINWLNHSLLTIGDAWLTRFVNPWLIALMMTVNSASVRGELLNVIVLLWTGFMLVNERWQTTMTTVYNCLTGYLAIVLWLVARNVSSFEHGTAFRALQNHWQITVGTKCSCQTCWVTIGWSHPGVSTTKVHGHLRKFNTWQSYQGSTRIS